MKRSTRITLYFIGWYIMIGIAIVLNYLNVDWEITGHFKGWLLLVIVCGLEGSALEFAVMTITVLVYRNFGPKDKKALKREYNHNLTCIMNYNLLATSEEDVDETFQGMYDAYMTNLSPNVSAVLVSATNDPDLKEYEFKSRDNFRALIRDTLMQEGKAFVGGKFHEINPQRLAGFWKKFYYIPCAKFKAILPDICDIAAKEFMCIQRVSRVLKKCGQYQDLMLLSMGDDKAFSYTDPDYYGRSSRPYNEPLFFDGVDTRNIISRNFDYTLVLDGDTGVPPGCLVDLLAVASAYPDRGIIQPALNMEVGEAGTIYMNIESWRQWIYDPFSKGLGDFFEQGAYFGKALIRNDVYIDKVIGTREQLIERVPIDVLSHDTFEAAVLKPMYCDEVRLAEAPSLNYVCWHIRERRWNQGEVILGCYFWPDTFGKVVHKLRRWADGEKYQIMRLRTPSQLDFVSAYIAHSAIRQMCMKPLLLMFTILHIGAKLHRPWDPLIIMMFIVVVFPKFATVTCEKFPYILVETATSIVQYMPEAIIGTVRVYQAITGAIFKTSSKGWVPQRAVEESFRSSNPFVSSIKHLWGFSVMSAFFMLMLVMYEPYSYLPQVMLACTFMIPLFTGMTTLTLDTSVPRAPSEEGQGHKDEALMNEVSQLVKMNGVNSNGVKPGIKHSTNGFMKCYTDVLHAKLNGFYTKILEDLPV